MYNIKPVEHNGTVISFALCQFVGEANMHISSHESFIEAQKALKALKPEHQIPRWCQDLDDEDDFDWEDGYLDNGDFDHDVESAGGAENFWHQRELEQEKSDPNDITTEDWVALDKVIDKIAGDAINNGGVVNHDKFKDEVENTRIHQILSGTDVWDVFLNTYHNGIDARLERAGYDPYSY